MPEAGDKVETGVGGEGVVVDYKPGSGKTLIRYEDGTEEWVDEEYVVVKEGAS